MAVSGRGSPNGTSYDSNQDICFGWSNGKDHQSHRNRNLTDEHHNEPYELDLIHALGNYNREQQQHDQEQQPAKEHLNIEQHHPSQDRQSAQDLKKFAPDRSEPFSMPPGHGSQTVGPKRRRYRANKARSGTSHYIQHRQEVVFSNGPLQVAQYPIDISGVKPSQPEVISNFNSYFRGNFQPQQLQHDRSYPATTLSPFHPTQADSQSAGQLYQDSAAKLMVTRRYSAPAGVVSTGSSDSGQFIVAPTGSQPMKKSKSATGACQNTDREIKRRNRWDKFWTTVKAAQEGVGVNASISENTAVGMDVYFAAKNRPQLPIRGRIKPELARLLKRDMERSQSSKAARVRVQANIEQMRPMRSRQSQPAVPDGSLTEGHSFLIEGIQGVNNTGPLDITTTQAAFSVESSRPANTVSQPTPDFNYSSSEGEFWMNPQPGQHHRFVASSASALPSQMAGGFRKPQQLPSTIHGIRSLPRQNIRSVSNWTSPAPIHHTQAAVSLQIESTQQPRNNIAHSHTSTRMMLDNNVQPPVAIPIFASPIMTSEQLETLDEFIAGCVDFDWTQSQ